MFSRFALVFVRPCACHHVTTVNFSVCLCLSRLSVLLLLACFHCCLVIQCRQLFLVNIYVALSACVPLNLHSSWRFSWMLAWFKMCPFIMLCLSFWVVKFCLSVYYFTGVFSLTVLFSVTFSVKFELYVHGCLQASVDNIMKEKMPKKGGRWWFSWRSRNSDSKSVSRLTHFIICTL